ncbi:GAF domain-containing protein [Romeria aff. gracilis LEGE 07310]|uniref:histidine kinase n=1 Tax=Vasconcelosia minhoensis LEGE 07310 TaxID=915328 RepID=A0A8J7DR41_9CYAN|nr:ATP-binding protein [Romeria gracilis]MBE9077719.1 GAF domain-containing protein [Romeria aff. gracilis LEGE 07310]
MKSDFIPPAQSAAAVTLDSLVGAIAAAVYVKTAQHHWLYANEACGALLGQTPAALIELGETAFLSEAAAQQLRQDDAACFDRGTGEPAELELTLSSGSSRRLIVHRALLQLDQQPVLVNTLVDVTAQLALATLTQLNQQMQRAHASLRQEITEGQTRLQTALAFEATLKRVTDRVRDSLDEAQILQTAMRELTEALGVKGANTALYDLEQGTSTIYQEYTIGLHSSQGRVAQMEDFPEVYTQLLEGQYLQFCSIIPNPVRGHVAMFASPILDDRGVLGDLWLINDPEYGFKELDIRLVQQVTNQCAIAIRQARLYQEAQLQVQELERVNTLKDDFLSTVSHELRTPVTSMRVALQLLGVTLNQEFDLNAELQKPMLEQRRVARYYRILQEECEREIGLINDLLDLQRLDVGNHPILPQPIQLSGWLPSLMQSFQERAQSRQQTLDLTIPADLPPLVSDLSSLERILAELLNNACKYTPPGGAIRLTARATEANRLCLSLTNTGVEISPEERDRIFDKFYRIPSADPWKQGGTGLGLALVKRLLMHLEGEIGISSGHDATTFWVELPQAISAKSLS